MTDIEISLSHHPYNVSRLFQSKIETPTRYRSLDTLTAAKADGEQLPAPGPLTKRLLAGAYGDDNGEKKVSQSRLKKKMWKLDGDRNK